MNKRVIGFDARKVRRNNFEAVMGVSVCVHDCEKFNEEYYKIIKEEFEKSNLPYSGML